MFGLFRRRRPAPEAIDQDLWTDTRRALPWLASLDPGRDARLRTLTALFLQRKAITPVGGLQLDPQSIQMTARLSVAEVFALLISVASMRAAASLPFSRLADSGLARIEAALPPDKLADLRRFIDCLYVGPLSPQVDISDMGMMDPGLLEAFETAFLQRHYLRFQYRDAKEAVTNRHVEPQAMLILPPLWYLVAWDPARKGFRHFRMDRITRPEIDEATTFRRRHVPFEDHVRPVSSLSR